jgi:aconitate hydratase
VERVALKLRIDTPIEVEYYNKGGILPFVLGQLPAGRPFLKIALLP